MIRSIRGPILACLLAATAGCDDPAAERAERQRLVQSMQDRDRQNHERQRQLTQRINALE